ncbi:MAG: FISUMP domain-containing protein [Bacteroidota bacterium]|nr:FISUMP domain-containing protein [Bacteroidota bacterium]
MKIKFSHILYLIIFVIVFTNCKDGNDIVSLPTQLGSGDTIFTADVDTFVTLNALPLEKGLTGKWQIVSANSKLGSFQNAASPTTRFFGKYRQTYTLRWTVSNGIDSASTNVTVNLLGVFTDTRDNQQYKLIKIGNQIWMAENFRFRTDSSLIYQNDSVTNYKTYGRLYTIADANNSAPAGWHLPTVADDQILTTNIRNYGFTNKEATALKATTGWSTTAYNGTDYFGFAALPSGYSTQIGTAAPTFTGSTAHFWNTGIDANHNCQYLIIGTTANIGGTGLNAAAMPAGTVYRRSVRYLRY